MDDIFFGCGEMLLLIAIPPCLTIDTVSAYYDLESLYPPPTAEKNFKFETGDQFYDLPQLKDFGLTKTPGHTMSPLIRFPN